MPKSKAHRWHNEKLGHRVLLDSLAHFDNIELLHDYHWNTANVGELEQLSSTKDVIQWEHAEHDWVRFV